jgi:hypothetical protein
VTPKSPIFFAAKWEEHRNSAKPMQKANGLGLLKGRNLAIFGGRMMLIQALSDND